MTLERDVDENVVRDLRHLLEQAERGDIRAVAIAAARRDHIRLTYVSGLDGDYTHDIVAAERVLALRIDQHLLEAPRVPPLPAD